MATLSLEGKPMAQELRRVNIGFFVLASDEPVRFGLPFNMSPKCNLTFFFVMRSCPLNLNHTESNTAR